MKVSDVLNQYPFAAKEVRKWFMNQLLTSTKEAEIPEEFKQMVIERGVNDEHIIEMLEIQPRSFFDLFDDFDLCIQISGNRNIGFSWEIDSFKENPVCLNRKTAEINAVLKSFEILENQLKEEK